ncbi:GcvT family protein [Amaricoccus solimangrovi]|uniref:FAD-dependent oxidoreductase n=1 Tax=Amaricoccus solimangrovi TaxID=2589815 RepID=A0A501WQ66_9RHOB|nr:FAD-dependent oxidoreductase [Amaricoccus solimangrovi]TPE51609.1 FAD-dependent oxidoreductase [Amaricoccus solimangrovi]
MTEHARIIIIGGGIVGVSTLYHLAKAGEKDALLLERRELTAGATWHAAGNVHTQSAYANLSALQAYSLRLYDGLAEEVGQEVGSHVVGGFFLAQTRERMEEFRHLAGKFRALGLEYELVTPGEIKAKYPLMNTDGLVGGAWDPEEGYVDPYSVTMGLAAGARKYGGRIRRGTQVDGITRLPSGHWRLTAGDAVFECEILVNCAGFWAREVAEMVGTTLPITNMEHHYLVTEAMPEVAALDCELPMIRDTDSQYYLRQEGKGLLLGPWERDCRRAWGHGRAPWSFGQELFENDIDRLSDVLGAIYDRIPSLETAGIRRIVNGAISFAPDGRPMIGPMPGVPGFFVACGFLGGIAQGGGIGLAMSQWILEGEPERDLHFIDVARYGDWTTREFARERTYEIFPIRYEIIYPQLERASGRDQKVTPIHTDLLARGAVMGQAFGWERPLWYAPEGVAPKDEPSFHRPNWWEHVGREAKAMAEGCGLSEMSSYGKLRVRGRDAAAFLDRVGSAKVPGAAGKVALSLLLNERGGIIADVTITKEADNSFYLVCATTGVLICQRWLDSHAAGFEVTIENVTDATAVLGVAGPNSRALLNRLSDGAFDDFPLMTSKVVEIGSARCRAIRVSFSGELGWELHCPMVRQKPLFDALVAAGSDHGMVLLGTRALGMLRIEKGYRGWGAELTAEVTPSAAGLERFCSRGKDYIGRAAVDALRGVVPPKRYVTLEIAPEAPPCWGTEPVLRNGELIGYVTSGGMGWRSGKMLAVAWVGATDLSPGDAVQVSVLTETYAARVGADSVYDPANSRLLG